MTLVAIRRYAEGAGDTQTYPETLINFICHLNDQKDHRGPCLGWLFPNAFSLVDFMPQTAFCFWNYLIQGVSCKFSMSPDLFDVQAFRPCHCDCKLMLPSVFSPMEERFVTILCVWTSWCLFTSQLPSLNCSQVPRCPSVHRRVLQGNREPHLLL
jgi:hypothetical protein